MSIYGASPMQNWSAESALCPISIEDSPDFWNDVRSCRTAIAARMDAIHSDLTFDEA
jgi:hypothetical protein